jgi:hypothetical protein
MPGNSLGSQYVCKKRLGVVWQYHALANNCNAVALCVRYIYIYIYIYLFIFCSTVHCTLCVCVTYIFLDLVHIKKQVQCPMTGRSF